MVSLPGSIDEMVTYADLFAFLFYLRVAVDLLAFVEDA
jgi:hypothetical protein